MNAISRREEDALLKGVKAKALKECAPVVKDFAECATGRTISLLWACKDKYKLLQDCMFQFTSPESMDKARAEYIRKRDQQPSPEKS